MTTDAKTNRAICDIYRAFGRGWLTWEIALEKLIALGIEEGKAARILLGEGI